MQLKRVLEQDVTDVYYEDTYGRKQTNNRTKDFVPYVYKKRKETVPIYPVISYNIYSK